MVDTITNSLDIWTAAKELKANGRGKSVDKQSMYGVKKLRKLVLELAVRGKLVPQNPNDEPASVFLEKIASEKARLIKEGIIKKQKPLPNINEGEKPFEMPKGWEWARLGEVTNYGISDKAVLGSVDEGTWVLELEDVEKETSKLLQKKRVADRKFRSSKSRFCKGDVIYGKLRPYLDKVIIADEDGICTTEMIPLRGYDYITPQYLRLVMKSPYFIWYANESTHGMNLPRMGTDKARLTLFPMVSVNEQHRIVAKVDELMALCDQLEKQQTDSNSAHRILVETLLDTLTNSADPQELESNWQRIADYFDTLFTAESSINQLKQTILQMAMTGKLVPQNPNDEPASMLLEKIAKEKARLVKENKIKKQKPLTEIREDEKPFNLPVGWEFVRLGDIANRIGSGSTPRGGKSAYVESGIPFLRSQNVWNHGLELSDVAYISEETHQKMSNTVVVPNDILLNITGASLGRCAVYPDGLGEANVSQHVTIIRPTDAETRFFLHLCILSPYTQALVWSRQVGMAREGLSKKVLELFEIPIPPQEEQYRIVAQVDKLFAICDNLKSHIEDAENIQVQLADAIVEQAVA